MLKLILQVALIVALMLGVLWMIDPVATYSIINAVYRLPSTSTTTITIPPTTAIKTIYANYTRQSIAYGKIANNTLVAMNGQYNNDTITTQKQVILYLYIRGGFNTITVRNAVLVLLVVGEHNQIDLQNTTLLSSNILKGTQIYNDTNTSNSTT